MTFVARNALLAACRAWQQQVPLAAAAHRGLDAAPGALQHRGYAAATAGVVPADLDTLDRIILKGLVFHGFHGALPEENVLGQKFIVDATMWTDLSAACASDRLGDTIDYGEAYREVQAVVEGPAQQLQEAVAQEISDRLLAMDPRVAAVRVYMRKPHVALPGVLESVGVELLRRRQAPSH